MVRLCFSRGVSVGVFTSSIVMCSYIYLHGSCHVFNCTRIKSAFLGLVTPYHLS